ncbi:cupin domain-containing protein [Candidatus Bathyarchaeota archaeon]|nr:cupin domain-containing protein [Candidatus Bathyarchaeota archaeon]
MGIVLNEKNMKWEIPEELGRDFVMKTLITGAMSDNKLTFLVCELNPGGELFEHLHETQFEIHYIVSGSGVLTVENKKFNVQAGSIAIGPPKEKHSLKNTGDETMRFLAIFSPALR